MTMLKRLFPSQDIDALLGDISEEAPRRSRLWYWSQLVAVVVVASWRDTRKHPWLTLRAMTTGFVTLTIYFGIVQFIGRIVRVLSNGGYYVAGHWLTLPSRPLPPPPFDVLTAHVIIALGFLITGCAIVRFHRAHGVALAMPFLLLTTLTGVVLLTVLATDTGPGTRPMPLREFVGIFGTMLVSIPIGTVAGSLLGLRWKRT
jgi:hypothetical protein